MVFTRSISHCPFCALARGGLNSRKVYFEDALFMVIDAKHPRASVHQLVVSKAHIQQSILWRRSSLSEAELTLLEDMVRVGEMVKERILNTADSQHGGASRTRLVFHKPPFNSMEHLHMHVLAGEFVNWYRDIAHRPGTPWCLDAKVFLSEKRASKR